MEREVVWRGRWYGEGGGMEREVVWRGRGYGEGGGMEREVVRPPPRAVRISPGPLIGGDCQGVCRGIRFKNFFVPIQL
jgi:hypothetical protein